MPALHLFEGFGVELEYMIVDRETLCVAPMADELIRRVAGAYLSEVERGELSWSNELALHVVELKTNGPAASLVPLAELFQDHVQQVDEALAPLGAQLLPTAMHPWMDPHTEMKLWPHEFSPVYEAFNRVFDCRGHGWANLQSMHVNLPFAGDEEFGRLHAAIRLVLPILPALAASSPIMDGRLTGLMDTRLEVYRHNARRVPEVSGQVIPERAFTQAEYDAQIFAPLYAAIAPLDPEGALRDEFLNARGAIARFSRGSIEIRLLDVQECPQADLAICRAVVAVLEALVGERWTSVSEQQSFEVAPLAELLTLGVRDAERALVSDANYLRQFGWTGNVPCTAGELWRHLAEVMGLLDEGTQLGGDDANSRGALRTILDEGPLARRIAARLGEDVSREHLRRIYGELAECLRAGRVFRT